MTRKLLLLICVLAFLTVTSNGQDNYRPKKKDLSWGIRSDGLRMAVWTNPETDKVFAAVRNFTSKPIRYCDSEYGNAATVYARKNAASEWQELKFKAPGEERVMLPICLEKVLRPNQEMPLFSFYGRMPGQNYSFYQDLQEYDFPADWNDTAEVKVAHFVIISRNRPCDYDLIKCNGKVESQPVKIKLPFGKAALRR